MQGYEIIEPSIEYMSMTKYPLEMIEVAGRTCYKSEDRITKDSAELFVKGILARGHEAIIEHASMSYKVICDRGVSHEIVRHRLFSFAQESTRYCNYTKDKFGGNIKFINPCFWEKTDMRYVEWQKAIASASHYYHLLVFMGANAQEARSILPNSLKTEIVVTGNFREWRHFFRLRTDKTAHPQMRQVANLILADAKERVNIVFDEFCPAVGQ